MDEASPAPGSVPLNGWKEIAGYLGRSVRAVQRYERELGLPVHRLRTADGQTVYAFREEIDRWRQKLDQPHGPEVDARDEDGDQEPDAHGGSQPPHVVGTSTPTAPMGVGRGTVWLGAALLVALVTVVGFAIQSWGDAGMSGEPSAIRLSGNTMEALASSGQVLWTHRFDQRVNQPVTSGLGAKFLDLDGDGAVEAIVPLRPGLDPNKVTTTTDTLYAFSHNGRPLWSVAPDVTIVCGEDTFTGPWDMRAMALGSTNGGRVVWLAYVHHTWRPSFVLEVRPDGDAHLRYVQAGWVTAISEWTTPAGRLLAAGGVLNERSLASVALIDPGGLPARSPADTDRNACSQNSTAAVRRLILFPNVDSTGTPYDLITEVRVVGSDLRVNYESGMAFARLTPDLRVAEYGIADSYFVRHRELEQEGRLDHPASACPFVDAEHEIHEWSAVGGWQTLRIKATVGR